MGTQLQGRGRGVVLVGFSGSGKTTLGKLLATKRNCRFVDLDAEIVRHQKMSIADMFAGHGERYFRRAETATLKSIVLSSSQSLVLALGGGAFESAGNRRLARKLGVVVHLKCSVKELYRRIEKSIDRPIMNAILHQDDPTQRERLAKIKTLVAKREPHYRMADVAISTSNGTKSKVLARLVNKIDQYYEKHPS